MSCNLLTNKWAECLAVQITNEDRENAAVFLSFIISEITVILSAPRSQTIIEK